MFTKNLSEVRKPSQHNLTQCGEHKINQTVQLSADIGGEKTKHKLKLWGEITKNSHRNYIWCPPFKNI